MNNEITAGNTLIAGFVKLQQGCQNRDWKKLSDKNLGMDVSELKYHISWNWLMPIIEKISRIEYDRWEEELPFGDAQTMIDTAYPRTFGMLSQEGKPMFRFNRYSLHIADSLIEAAWLAVVEFIIHQSEQKCVTNGQV